MSEGHDIRAELGLEDSDPEAAPLTALALRLRAERPVPAAAFRGELSRRLQTRSRRVRQRPRRLKLLIATYGCAGSSLLAVAALSAAGLGPLAA